MDSIFKQVRLPIPAPHFIDLLQHFARYKRGASTCNTADFVRFRLAQLSRKAGRDEEALKFLREITPDKGGMAGMRRLIPGIERKLQLQNPRQGVNP